MNNHPEIISRQDDQLRSINYRLGLLCDHFGCSGGEDLPPLQHFWATEYLAAKQFEKYLVDKQLDEAKEESESFSEKGDTVIRKTYR